MVSNEMLHIDIVAHFIRQDTTRTLEELCELCRPYLIEFMSENKIKQYIANKMSVIK